MRTHPLEEEPSISSKEDKETVTHQGSKVPSQSAGEGSDPPKEPNTATVKAAEAALEDHCWIPFGVQSQSVGPEGGTLCLQPSAGVTGREEEGETILLQVPPGAVSPSESVDVHSAVIPDGPFTLPEGYQFGSMVVYIYYDGRRVTRPLRLRLPHWYGGEDHVQDGLAFAMAPHTLKEGEHAYRFELLEGGRRLNSHCGELEIDGHCSLFAEVYKKGAISRYQAISVQKQDGDETTCAVAVTYAFPLWCDILTKYRNGWTVDLPFCPFTFSEDRLKGKLKKESANGWQAVINGSSELEPNEVDYSSHGITTPKLLKVAVLNRGYPPSITFAVTYREELRRTGRPVWVCLDLFGAGKELTFKCKAYEEVGHQQLDGSRNAAAASQSPLTLTPDPPPPDVVADRHSSGPSHAETASLPSLTPVSVTTSSASSNPPQSAPTPLTPRHILAALNRRLDAKWRHFGTFLGVEYQIIESIKTGNSGNPEECMLELVSKWTSNQGGTGTLPRTWQTVVEAVQSSGDKALAQGLSHKHGVLLTQ